VFRRRTPAEPESSPETLARTGAEDGTTATRKGRATPSRKEAERLRKERLAQPKDRRELARRERQRTKATRAKSRRALLSGDEKQLPPRDAGPVRAFARDFIDARRTAAQYFLPGALVILALSLPQNVTLKTISMLLWIVMLLVMVVDSVIVGRRLSREAARRFPDAERRGLVGYALRRSLQVRRLRLPPPRVKPGDPI
jgi:hypothetical protein